MLALNSELVMLAHVIFANAWQHLLLSTSFIRNSTVSLVRTEQVQSGARCQCALYIYIHLCVHISTENAIIFMAFPFAGFEKLKFCAKICHYKQRTWLTVCSLCASTLQA